MRKNDKKPSIFSSFPSLTDQLPLRGDALLAKVLPDESSERIHLLVRDYAKASKKSGHEDGENFAAELGATLMARLDDNLSIAANFQDARKNIYYTKLALKEIGQSLEDDLLNKIHDHLGEIALREIKDAEKIIEIPIAVSGLQGSLGTVKMEMTSSLQEEIYSLIMSKATAMLDDCKYDYEKSIVKSLTLRALIEAGTTPEKIIAFKELFSFNDKPAPAGPKIF